MKLTQIILWGKRSHQAKHNHRIKILVWLLGLFIILSFPIINNLPLVSNFPMINNLPLINSFPINNSLLAVASKNKESKKTKLPQVYVTPLKKTKISEHREYWGLVEPTHTYFAFSPVNGLLSKLNVNVGDLVTKDQVIATVQKKEIGYDTLPGNITAPINGIVFKIITLPGNMINKDKAVLSIYSPDQFQFKIHMTPTDVTKVRLNQPIKAHSENNTLAFKGKIKSISPSIDHQTGTQEVTIHINKKSTPLLPGKLAKINFQFNPHQGFSVPKKHIKIKDDRTYIQIVRDGKVQEINIKQGIRFKNNIEIISNQLTKGLSIIIKSDQNVLVKDQQVEIVEKKKST